MRWKFRTKKSPWRRCETDPPKDGAFVLLGSEWGDVAKGVYEYRVSGKCPVCDVRQGGFYLYGSDKPTTSTQKHLFITHWMPLPEPPKEEV